ncbi:MAG: glycosyltransferase [Candidatus Eisenbacteria bacterium]|nr:glycosyltransferase [Candidatus Latescibacterota bacterium]MBD3301785.1 glycosyltransferase [Candidatus Eisenbacteria bacterium]
MNLAYVGTAYPMRGGIAQFNALLARELMKSHTVRFYSFTRQYPELLFPGKTQIEEGEDPAPVDARPMVDSILPWTWRRTADAIARERPDGLIFKYWMPFFAPCFGTIARRVRRRRLPGGGKTRVVVVCDNVVPHEKRPFDDLLTRYMLGAGDGFVVMSRAVERDLRRYRPEAPAVRIPHPLYTHFGEPMPKREARRRLGWDPDRRVLLFFGYIRRYKGLEDLLRAMPEIHARTGARLVVLGEFYEDRGRYDAIVRDLGIAEIVEMRGDYVPNEEVGVRFAASDLVVLPYRSATQSGIVQIAVQLERPALCTRVGGLEEMIDDGETGLLVPPDDRSALVRAIARFYEEGLENRLADGMRRAKAGMGWDAFAAAVVRLVSGSGAGAEEKGSNDDR